MEDLVKGIGCNLESLFLKFNKITKEGLVFLAKQLEIIGESKLREINLSDNELLD